MLVKRIGNIQPYLNPESSLWVKLSASTIPMTPTPLAFQPTQYVRVKWEKLPYGQLSTIETRAVHDGSTVAFFMEWNCAEEHPKDAVAIALPIRGQPILVLMGSADSPIHFLHWMAKNPGVRSTYSVGIGTTQLGVPVAADASGIWVNNKRKVVISRKMGVFEEAAPLKPGENSRIGYAVWQGANDERAGLKAFSVDWKSLEIDK